MARYAALTRQRCKQKSAWPVFSFSGVYTLQGIGDDQSDMRIPL